MNNQIEYIDEFSSEEQKGLEAIGVATSLELKKIRLGEFFGHELLNVNNDSRKVLYNQKFEKQIHLATKKGTTVAPVLLGPIDHEKVVFCVEGETDAIALSNFTQNVVSFPGANSTDLSKVCQNFVKHFKGDETIAIIFDNDSAGRKGAGELKLQLLEVLPRSTVKIVDISELDSNTNDLREGLFVKKSITFEALNSLTKKTPGENKQTSLLGLVADSETEKPKLPIAYDPEEERLFFSIAKQGLKEERLIIVSGKDGKKDVMDLDLDLFETEEPKDIPIVSSLKSKTVQILWHEKQDAKKIYNEIKSIFKKQIFFNDVPFFDIHVAYSFMTYVYPIFPTIPYIHINGNKHCGKSQLSHIHSDLDFNAMESTSSTMAAIRRLIHHDRGTIVFDDWERACNSENEEDMISLLNAGYATRSKSILTNKDTMRPMALFTGGPKIFNSINKIHPVLASRCIINKMMPASHDFIKGQYPSPDTLKVLKSKLLLWALENHGEVKATFSEFKISTSREEELYNPLLAIVSAIHGAESKEFEAILKIKANHMFLQGQKLGFNEIVLDEIHHLWSQKKTSYDFECSHAEIYESLLSRDDLPVGLHKNKIKDAIEAFNILLDQSRKQDKHKAKTVFYNINVPAMLSAWKTLHKRDVLPSNDFN